MRTIETNPRRTLELEGMVGPPVVLRERAFSAIWRRMKAPQPWRVELEVRATKDLDRLPVDVADRIRAALENLARDPFRRGLDVKMLKGEPNTRRLRVGPFRALFELDRVVRKVRVLRVPDRKDACGQNCRRSA